MLHATDPMHPTAASMAGSVALVSRPAPQRTVRDLPGDTLRDVFTHLTPQERAAAALTCREWLTIARPPLSYSLISGLRRCAGAREICALLAANTPRAAGELTHLDLRDRGLGDTGAAQVCLWLHAHAEQLHFLDLGGNGLTAAGAASLMLPSGLRVLNLADNRIGHSAGETAAALTLQLPDQLAALNLSCNPQLSDAYLDAQAWPGSLQLLAAAHCDLREWAPTEELHDLAHLDLAFNPSFARNAWPAVVHLDVRGTSSWRAVASSQHEAHPVPDLERLVLVQVDDAAPRHVRSWSGLTTVGIAAGLAGTAIATAHGEASHAIIAALIGGMYAAVVHTASADWHTARHARGGKRGGAAWYRPVEGPVPARPLPRAAAALQSGAVCLVGAAAGVGYTGAYAGGLMLTRLAFELSTNVATAAHASWDGGFFAVMSMTTTSVLSLGAIGYAYYLGAKRLPFVTMWASQWAGRHAAAGSYEIALRLEAKLATWRIEVGRAPHAYTRIADAV